MDENTRRQITWLILVGFALSLIVFVVGRRGEVDRLRYDLAYGDPQTRVMAVERLVETQKLAEAVMDQPRWIQDNAVEAVAYIGTEDAIFQLMTTWTVLDAPVQPRVTRTVVRFGEVAIPPLVEALKDKDGKTRAGVPGALTAIGEPVIPYLLPLMDAYDEYIRVGIATVFGGLADPVIDDMLEIAKRTEPAPGQSTEQFLRQKSTATNSLKNMKDKAFDKVIAELLTYEVPEIRGQAAQMLGEVAPGVPPEAAVVVIAPLLERLTTDTYWSVRRRAATALGNIGVVAYENGAVSPLIACLQDQRAEVRAAAAEALGRLNAKEAAPSLAHTLIYNRTGASRELTTALVRLGSISIGPLTPALERPEAEVRLLATQTIAEIGGRTALLPLARAMGDQTSLDVRQTATDALRNMSAEVLRDAPQEVAAALANGLRDDDWRVYHAARDALAKMGAVAVPTLISAMGSGDPRVAHMAEMALARIGRPAVEPLINALDSENPHIIQWVPIALGDIGADSVEPLKRVVSDTNRPVRTRAAAADALGRTRSPAAAQPLIAAAGAADPQLREAAIHGLGDLANEEATETLVKALSDNVPAVRVAATDVLKDWRLGNVTELLTGLLDSTDKNTSRRAAIAIVFQASTVSNQLLEQIGMLSGYQEFDAKVANILAETAADAGEDFDLRVDATLCLGYAGDENAIPTLSDLLKKGSRLQVVAARSVALIGTRLALAQLDVTTSPELGEASLLLLDMLLNPQDDDMRLAAAVALSDMGEIPVLTLSEALLEADIETGPWIGATMAAIGKPASDELLRVRGNTRDENQKAWASAILKVTGDAMAMQLMKHLPEDEQPREEHVKMIRQRLAEMTEAEIKVAQLVGR